MSLSLKTCSPRIWVIGNCQAEALAQSFSKVLPGQVGRSHISTPASLALREKDLFNSFEPFRRNKLLWERCFPGFQVQFPSIGPSIANPKIIVVTTFHETRPLLRHRTLEWALDPDPLPVEEFPELAEWIEGHFDSYVPETQSYAIRFHAMVQKLRADHPEARIFVIRRLSPLEKFGPNPYSYLLDWDLIEADFDKMLRSLAPLEVINLDDVVEALRVEAGLQIGALFPYFRYGNYGSRKPFPEGLGAYQWPPSREYFRIRMARDIEHSNDDLWDAVAREVLSVFEGGGRTGNAEGERGIAQGWNPPHISREHLEKEPGKITSWTGLFEKLLSLLPEKEESCLNFQTGSLLRFSDKYLLRMMSLYGDFAPSLPLTQFLEAHLIAVQTDGGDSGYAKKLSELIARLKHTLSPP